MRSLRNMGFKVVIGTILTALMLTLIPNTGKKVYADIPLAELDVFISHEFGSSPIDDSVSGEYFNLSAYGYSDYWMITSSESLTISAASDKNFYCIELLGNCAYDLTDEYVSIGSLDARIYVNDDLGIMRIIPNSSDGASSVTISTVAEAYFNVASVTVWGMEEETPEPTHVHSWAYTTDGSVLSVYCTETEAADSCSYQGVSNAMTLSVSASDIYYSDSAYSAAYGVSVSADGMLNTETGISANAGSACIYAKDSNGNKTGSNLNGTILNAGNYIAELSISTAAGTKTISDSFTVMKSDCSIHAPEGKFLVYNGNPQVLTDPVEVEGGTPAYSLTPGGPFTAEIPSGTDARWYDIYYKAIGDANHNDTTGGFISSRIRPGEYNPDMIHYTIPAGEEYSDCITLPAELDTAHYYYDVATEDPTFISLELIDDNQVNFTCASTTVAGESYLFAVFVKKAEEFSSNYGAYYLWCSIDATDCDHTERTHHDRIDPTCTSTGVNEYWTCGCGLKFDSATGGHQITDDDDLIIPTCAHREVPNEDKEPTCTSSGHYGGTHCEVCGESIVHSTYVPSLGHDFEEEFTIDREATCTRTGIKSRHCSRCSSKIETTVIEKAPHTEVAIGEGKAATCMETGLTKGVKCAVCEKVIEKQKVIPKTGHDFSGEYIIDEYETCCSEGHMHKECVNPGCNAKSESVVIPVHQHTEEAIGTAKAATCCEDGITAGVKCHECGKVFEKQRVIPALGHDFSGEWIVIEEPEENKAGTAVKICMNGCGTKKYMVIPATGAKDDEPQTDKGVFDKETEVAEDAPIESATFDNTKEELLEAEKLFTEDEKKEIETGKDARVYLAIDKLEQEKIPAEVRHEIENVAKDKLGDNNTIRYMDIALFKQMGNDAAEMIHEPGVDIRVTIEIPEDMLLTSTGMVRNYSVLRNHEGEAEAVVGEYDRDNRKLSFKTDKFSTYAIAYSDVKAELYVTPGRIDETKFVGEQVELDAWVYPSEYADQTVTYTSSDENVLKVDENGVITMAGTGKATVTVKAAYDSLYKNIEISVKERETKQADREIDHVSVKTEGTDEIQAGGKTEEAIGIVLDGSSADHKCRCVICAIKKAFTHKNVGCVFHTMGNADRCYCWIWWIVLAFAILAAVLTIMYKNAVKSDNDKKRA